MARVLAIDYGKKRCGLAVTDELKLIATGLDYVYTQDLLKYLKQYKAENNIEGFVLGEPKQTSGKHSETWPAIKSLAKKLKKEFDLPIYYQDERYTSKMAQRSLIEGGIPKLKRREKGIIDQVSATIILQSWLYNRTELNTKT